MTEHLTTGERVAWYRRRRGLSQEVLAGLVGRTTDWLSKVENNRIELDRLSVITSLASALDVSLGDLLAEPALLASSPDARGRTVPALREALLDYKQLTPLLGSPPDDEPPALEDLRAEVKQVLDAYQESRYGLATRRLPLVLADALAAARSYSGREGEEAYAELALAYHSAAMVLGKVGESGARVDRGRPWSGGGSAKWPEHGDGLTFPGGHALPDDHRPLRCGDPTGQRRGSRHAT